MTTKISHPRGYLCQSLFGWTASSTPASALVTELSEAVLLGIKVQHSGPTIEKHLTSQPRACPEPFSSARPLRTWRQAVQTGPPLHPVSNCPITEHYIEHNLSCPHSYLGLSIGRWIQTLLRPGWPVYTHQEHL